MKTVKFSYIKGDESRWGSFERQSPGGKCIWGDYRFVFNEDIDECDYWVVFDQIPKTETCKCPEKNTIFITAEPPSIGVYPTAFLNQFNHIITSHFDICQNRKLRGFVTMYQQSPPWLVNKTYDELTEMDTIPKTKLISLITTKKYKDRYNMAMELKKHFGDKIDLFGDGINPIKNKWDALAPYKYCIAMENERTADYFTEKLTDCYLALTYPIYYGCENLNTGIADEDLYHATEYFPKGSYSEIVNINYTYLMIRKIERILALEGHYDQALPYLKQSRRMVLNKYNIYPMLINYIESATIGFDKDLTNKKEITISDKARFIKDKTMFFKKLWRNL
jgi:hypothetical protein